MIPLILQDHLVDIVLPDLFSDFYLKNAKKEEALFNTYSQFLPARTSQNELKYLPFIIVSIMKGQDPGMELTNEVDIQILVGTIDEDDSYQGYRDCVNAMEKMYQLFMRKRFFNNKFEIQYPIDWQLLDESYYPVFFGVMNTKWSFAKVTEEDLLI